MLDGETMTKTTQIHTHDLLQEAALLCLLALSGTTKIPLLCSTH